MENLNKQQIILLTLLVSFVTSIVTGITVVSLLDQAPQGVTQTINRVVEKTIETVVPSEPLPPKQVTVIVKEQDLVTRAVERGEVSIVRIKEKREDALLGMGVIVRADGVIAVDAGVVGKIKSLDVSYMGGMEDAEQIGIDKETGIAFYRIATTTPQTPVALADSNLLKSGQSVVSISGPERNTVSVGIISSLIRGAGVEGADGPIIAIDTTMSPEALLSGTPVFNLDGELIALKAGKDGSGSDVLGTSGRISEALARIVR